MTGDARHGRGSVGARHQASEEPKSISERLL
jgi:hypothetical protein